MIANKFINSSRHYFLIWICSYDCVRAELEATFVRSSGWNQAFSEPVLPSFQKPMRYWRNSWLRLLQIQVHRFLQSYNPHHRTLFSFKFDRIYCQRPVCRHFNWHTWITKTVLINFLDPKLQTFEWVLISHIINYYYAMSPFIICACDGSEAILSRCVPLSNKLWYHLHSYFAPFDLDILHFLHKPQKYKIHSDGIIESCREVILNVAHEHARLSHPWIPDYQNFEQLFA